MKEYLLDCNTHVSLEWSCEILYYNTDDRTEKPALGKPLGGDPGAGFPARYHRKLRAPFQGGR